jgi:hypothetical protein
LHQFVMSGPLDRFARPCEFFSLTDFRVSLKVSYLYVF